MGNSSKKLRDLWENIHMQRGGRPVPALASGMLAGNLCLMLRLSRYRCQTCRTPTSQPRRKGGGLSTDMTRGHICSIRHSSGATRYWINQCRQCNSDQGALSFYEWLDKLRQEGDPRARQVFSTFMAMLQLGVPLDQIDAGVWVRRLPRHPVCSDPVMQAAE